MTCAPWIYLGSFLPWILNDIFRIITHICPHILVKTNVKIWILFGIFGLCSKLRRPMLTTKVRWLAKHDVATSPLLAIWAKTLKFDLLTFDMWCISIVVLTNVVEGWNVTNLFHMFQLSMSKRYKTCNATLNGEKHVDIVMR